MISSDVKPLLLEPLLPALELPLLPCPPAPAPAAAPARASARASLLALSARSARCMHGFLPMWLMGDQPNRSCMLKYEYMRAMGSRSVSTMRIVGAAA